VTISNETQQYVRQRADFLCEYCHSPEFLSTAPLTIDHILPKSLGGSDNSDNLALACRHCNGYRYNFVTGIDPQTEEAITLFNPRQQQWFEHFLWTADGLKIMGVTSVGRATCKRLDLNDERRPDKFIQASRRLWVMGGWHPPKQDPRLASNE